MKLIKQKIILSLLCFLISACGFHLRGRMDIPTWIDTLAVINQTPDKQLTILLESLLESYHIRVTQNLKRAHYWFIINNETLEQRIVSIGASTNPRQYQLIMTLNFTLQTPKGITIIPQQKLSVTRQFTANNDRILGSNQEQTLLEKEMRQEATVLMMNRLTSKHPHS